MSHLRRLFSLHLRQLSTCRANFRPALSADYKSKDTWDDRLDCTVLGGDQDLIKTINTKILSDSELTNLEVDVFINIAAPRKKDIAQLQEAVNTLKKFRKSLHAHTLLPSSPHAICRLFLDSDKLPSLMRLLERRIEFGIFPDPIALNILFDEALESEQYAIASRLAALIMLQEEFGLNEICDNFALYSVAKYIESQTDFSDWIEGVSKPDPILNPELEEQLASQASEESGDMDKKKEEAEEDEDDEDDAQYIRIPFLRNPYNDDHFDLTNPRQICGKTLSMLGLHLMGTEKALGAKCQALGEILRSRWTQANEALSLCVQSKVQVDDKFVETAKFYLENLHGLKDPDDQVKQSLITKLDKLPRGSQSISDEADARHQKLRDLERDDIKQFRQYLNDWSELRVATRKAIVDLEVKKKLIEEIKAKKRELKYREQYLFFYDNLKKSNLTRINYD